MGLAIPAPNQLQVVRHLPCLLQSALQLLDEWREKQSSRLGRMVAFVFSKSFSEQ
jgi:hypothetical protein